LSVSDVQESIARSVRTSAKCAALTLMVRPSYLLYGNEGLLKTKGVYLGWNDEQLAPMQRIGNELANKFWEARKADNVEINDLYVKLTFTCGRKKD
jgi:hypothetical protein